MPTEPPMTTKYESADLLLKLYDLRREPVLRKARAWFREEFRPRTTQDVQFEQQIGTLVFGGHGWLRWHDDQETMGMRARRRARPARSPPPRPRSAAAGGGPAASGGARAPT